MTSRRDVVPPAVQEDLDRLHAAALGAAVESMEKQGAFFPEALTPDASGQLAFMDITWIDSDAVRVDLEHRDGGPAVIIRTPYRIKKRVRRRSVTSGPAHESDDERRMWP